MTTRQAPAWIRGLPDDAMVPVRWVREKLAATPGPESTDPTVDVIAEELDRSPSTVRGWCPRIPGAYRAAGREWRIPRDGLRRFLEGEERSEPAVELEARSCRCSAPVPDRCYLGSWVCRRCGRWIGSGER